MREPKSLKIARQGVQRASISFGSDSHSKSLGRNSEIQKRKTLSEYDFCLDEAPSDRPRQTGKRKEPKDNVVDLEGMENPFGERSWEDTEEYYWR